MSTTSLDPIEGRILGPSHTPCCTLTVLSVQVGHYFLPLEKSLWVFFTGFSFTEDDRGYAKSSEVIARDLFSALVQFYQLFPDFQGRELFIAGEGYAGEKCNTGKGVS